MSSSNWSTHLRKHWFLWGMVVCVIGGGGFGHSGTPAAIRWVLWLIQPVYTTAIVLFLMAFSLDISKQREAIRNPGAALWGCLVNIGLLPLITWPLAQAQLLADFQLGLLVTAATPCTLATASVFTRRAGGNDAVSLMITLITNLGCVLITPFWLQWFLGSDGGFDAKQMIVQLAACVVLPTILGQLSQLPARVQPFVRAYRKQIGMVAQCLVLLLVTIAAVSSGRVLAGQAFWPGPLAVATIIGSCILVHLAAVAIGWYGGRAGGLPRSDTIAVAIAGSQKTLPVGLMIVTGAELAAVDLPFITFPLVIYHVSQLLIDAMLAERWHSREEDATT